MFDNIAKDILNRIRNVDELQLAHTRLASSSSIIFISRL